MGIKKIARPMNKAKNADNIFGLDEWDYYMIDYSDIENKYNDMSINEFMMLLD